MTRWPNQTEETIERLVVEDYQAKVPVETICVNRKVALKTVYRILDRFEVTDRRWHNKDKLLHEVRLRFGGDDFPRVQSKENSWLYYACLQRFGTWRRTLDLAGLKYRTHRGSRPFHPKPSPELSYLIGVYLGDGCVKRAERGWLFVLKAKDYDFLFSFQRALQQLTGKNYAISKEMNDVWVCICSWTSFATWLRDTPLEGLSGISMHYPSSFIRGVADSEGSSSGGFIRITNTNLDLLKTVQNALATLGIRSHIRLKARAGEEHYIRGKKTIRKKDCFDLCISKGHNSKCFFERVGFSIGRKNKMGAVYV